MEASDRYPDAAQEIAAWFGVVKAARWEHFLDLRQTFADADAVDNYVIFNIRRNRYRLITVVHYAGVFKGSPTMGHVYIRSFLSHKDYNNRAKWDKEYGR